MARLLTDSFLCDRKRFLSSRVNCALRPNSSLLSTVTFLSNEIHKSFPIE